MSKVFSAAISKHITDAGNLTADPNIFYLEKRQKIGMRVYGDVRHTSSENVRTDDVVARQK